MFFCVFNISTFYTLPYLRATDLYSFLEGDNLVITVDDEEAFDGVGAGVEVAKWGGEGLDVRDPATCIMNVRHHDDRIE